MSIELTKRSDVKTEETWKIEDLFRNETEWKQELENIEKSISSVTKFKGTFQDSANNLLLCLQAQEKLTERLILVGTYANLNMSVDGTDNEAQKNYALMSSALTRINTALSFIESELLSLSDEKVEKYFKEEPRLEAYRIPLTDMLKKKNHSLGAETEEVLASLGEVHGSPYRIYSVSKSSDMKFDSFKDRNGDERPLSFALFEDQYEISPNTDERRNAYQSFVKTLKQYENTYATVYATEVKKQVTISKLRNYSSVTEMLLQPQKVSEEMYENQLNIIYNELAPHMQRFARLKKKQLGLDEMKFCDLKAPLDPDFQPETTYEKVSELILESLEIMGTEYYEIMKKGLTERWVDRADNIGKATGAFCASPYGSHPYILMTWKDTMRGAFILTHELGHAGHFYLANKNQRIADTRPSTYFVEAPSTMNELLLGNHLLNKTDDPQMKRWVILQFLGTYYHNFVTHLLEGEFQRRVYKHAEDGKPHTAATLTSIKKDVLEGFWGDSVVLDEYAGLTWMRQPHYYMGLYPYTYSAGLTASTAVAKKIQEEGQPVVDRWLEVLKAGGTMSPQKLMEHAGVDMTNPDSIRLAVDYVASLIDQLEESYSK
ncbi:oligoendopeptidase F [Evansella cellulosilytica DSM 2522]|uniref:Oligopeptidase F n=1 Tax=Evansella cellulosilytica (strain ATCC 21833 / DSM 2522 / FERM P-1141 / JCM 9156 / N-4) TaxID=649639 RepID=E6U0B6_EVAC2|nr:oligoendopeptidase F [Evansella cellulosilytica]ADU30232.1 oligoendopeptidase F [Evansella cellulosilytica DSM 2522]